MSILHILNGDSTALSFEETGLDGDILVWREVLSEGPIEGTTTSADFWKKRSEWICETFNDTPDNYQQRVLNELAKLDEFYDEINLWFEFDLHCQVNLLGIMTYMQQKADLSAPAIYLICPGDYQGKEDFRGMGELNGEELVNLYDTIRVQLSEIDFILATEAWGIYVSRDAGKLKDFLDNTTFWGSLHLLKAALAAQLKRLPLNEKGLNNIEQRLVDIYNYGYKTLPEILSVFWEKEKIYGMGDMEINIYLQKLIKKKLIVLDNL